MMNDIMKKIDALAEEIVDVEIETGISGLPRMKAEISQAEYKQYVRKMFQPMSGEELLSFIMSLHPLDRLRLKTRYWTWDRKVFKRTLLSCTTLSRVALHRDLHPGRHRHATR